MDSTHPEIGAEIRDTGVLSDESTEALSGILKDFAAGFVNE